MVVLNCARLFRVGRKHHEGGVAAVSVGLRVVSKDGTGDGENIGTFGAIFRGKEHVDEVVVLPTLGRVDAGENFLFVAEFGGEGFVGFVLPGVFIELLHDLISVGFVLGTVECGSMGNEEVLVEELGFAPILNLGNADVFDGMNLFRGLTHHVGKLSANDARAGNGETHEEDEQGGYQVFRVKDPIACILSKRCCGICHDRC